MMKYVVNRDVSKKECYWLKETIVKGTTVYEYLGYTYGCVGTGMAVSLKKDCIPFFELPGDALTPYEQITGAG